MNKIITYIIIGLFLSLGFFAMNSVAGESIGSDGSMPLTAGGSKKTSENIVELSKNVYGFYNTDNTSGAAASFSAATFNSAGTEQYGVASDSGFVYKEPCASNPCGTSADPALKLTSGNSSDFSTSPWTH